MKRIVVLRFPPKIVDIVREDLSGFVLCHLSTPKALLMGDRKHKSPTRDGYPSTPRMQGATPVIGAFLAESHAHAARSPRGLHTTARLQDGACRNARRCDQDSHRGACGG